MKMVLGTLLMVSSLGLSADEFTDEYTRGYDLGWTNAFQHEKREVPEYEGKINPRLREIGEEKDVPPFEHGRINGIQDAYRKMNKE